MSITISHPTSVLKGSVELPLSKSESNRILILQALSGNEIDIGDMSDARDTRLLQAALASDSIEIDIQDAGTAMRFLTAYYCATNQHKILTGSERMKERPIGILVDALREIGFRINYTNKEGFPPLEIVPADLSLLKSEISIAGNVSSQYISALAMIAPVLEKGLKIHFTTDLSSKPYIDMTLEFMRNVGIESLCGHSILEISPQDFKEGASLSASADWTAASYWFSMAAIAEEAAIVMEGLNADTSQGDVKIALWGLNLGLRRKLTEYGKYCLCKNTPKNPVAPSSVLWPPFPNDLAEPTNRYYKENPDLYFDFTHYPDLAQTMIVLCAAKGLPATFTGLESLRIKETDRVIALQNELRKFGISLLETEKGFWQLSGTFTMCHQSIKTYNDHRMAMSFAPLALLGSITIEQPDVVEKSYPKFWEEMEKVGFEIN